MLPSSTTTLDSIARLLVISPAVAGTAPDETAWFTTLETSW